MELATKAPGWALEAIKQNGGASNGPSVSSPESPLSTGQVVTTLCNLGRQLQNAREEFDAIPLESIPDEVSNRLKTIIVNCQAAIKNAERLQRNGGRL